MGEWIVNAMPWPIYPREREPVPIVQVGWAPEPVGTGAEFPSRTDLPARSEALYRIRYAGPHLLNYENCFFFVSKMSPYVYALFANQILHPQFQLITNVYHQPAGRIQL